MGALRALVALLAIAPAARAELAFELIATTRLQPEHPAVEGPIGGISGLAYVPETGRWLGVSDTRAGPFVIEMSIGLARGGIHVVPERRIQAGGAPATDAESIALWPRSGRVFVGFESPPAIVRFGDDFEIAANLALPAEVVEHHRTNGAFESVALVDPPGGAELWAATEKALRIDGAEATEKRGTRCRVLIYDAETLALERQAIYETEARREGLTSIGSFNALSDATALGSGRVLFMERGFVLPRGAYVRLFVCDGSTIDEAPIPTLAKTFACDLHDLGVPFLGNLEAMAIGPDLEGGGRLMILMSDDNFGALGEDGTQVIALRVHGAD